MELSVSAENKMQLYQQLQILMNEVNVTIFSNNLDKFIEQWSTKEHDSFLTFQPTTTTGQVLYSLHQLSHTDQDSASLQSIDKWTKCYRHFNHRDTDSNMCLERYNHILHIQLYLYYIILISIHLFELASTTN